jgi:hypothetical protein
MSFWLTRTTLGIRALPGAICSPCLASVDLMRSLRELDMGAIGDDEIVLHVADD